MSLVDPISDMLTQIRNAYAVDKEKVCLSDSKVKKAILAILKEKGFISDFQTEEGKLCIELKYEDSKPVIHSIERISKPGRRVYVGKNEIPTVLSGIGTVVVSTPKGVMTGEAAKQANLGGELICKVY